MIYFVNQFGTALFMVLAIFLPLLFIFYFVKIPVRGGGREE